MGISVGGVLVITGFVRFATEGIGIPVPAEPNSRRLTVGGPYRYVRNPLYLAIVLAVTGPPLRRRVRGLPQACARLVAALATPQVLTLTFGWFLRP